MPLHGSHDLRSDRLPLLAHKFNYTGDNYGEYFEMHVLENYHQVLPSLDPCAARLHTQCAILRRTFQSLVPSKGSTDHSLMMMVTTFSSEKSAARFDCVALKGWCSTFLVLQLWFGDL
jgi:hypothetical protein